MLTALLPRLKSKPYLAVALLALLAFGGVALWRQDRVAPEVVFTTLTGEKISLHALRGKVVLINFWATSCAPCVHEMPRLAQAYRRLHAGGLEIIAVPASYDPPNAVLDYSQSRQLPFPVALDIDDGIAQAFGGLKAVPTTVVIDRDGNIVARNEGELAPDVLAHLLDQALTQH
jgi:peroxiredoxin